MSLIIKLIDKLTKIMLVKGKKKLVFSPFDLKSPGKLPNHLNALGKKYKIAPMQTMPIPM